MFFSLQVEHIICWKENYLCGSTDKFLNHILPFSESMMYQYFVKIVPTTYVKVDGKVRSFRHFHLYKILVNFFTN